VPPVAFDYLDQRPDIESARIVLSGLSMGSLWATTLAAVAVAMTWNTGSPRTSSAGSSPSNDGRLTLTL
jgi:hypothetical protein